jgi:autoinducer 2-degrading protein
MTARKLRISDLGDLTYMSCGVPLLKVLGGDETMKVIYKIAPTLLRGIAFTTVAIALVWATLITVPKALAQNTPRYMVSAVDLEITPAQLEKFLEALRENGASTIKEPGCRQYDILQLTSDPNQIHIYEVYENEAAVQAHRATDHFKKYQATTKDMVVKRQSRPMVSVATYSKPR